MNHYKVEFSNNKGVTEKVDVVANTIREAYATFKDEFGVIPISVSPK